MNIKITQDVFDKIVPVANDAIVKIVSDMELSGTELLLAAGLVFLGVSKNLKDVDEETLFDVIRKLDKVSNFKLRSSFQ